MPLMTAEFFGLGSLGVLLGIVNAGGAIGEAAGPVLAGGIFDVFGSYTWAFIICAFLGIIGIILNLLLKHPDGSRG